MLVSQDFLVWGSQGSCRIFCINACPRCVLSSVKDNAARQSELLALKLSGMSDKGPPLHDSGECGDYLDDA